MGAAIARKELNRPASGHDATDHKGDEHREGFTNGVMTGGLTATAVMAVASIITGETTAAPLAPVVTPGRVHPAILLNNIAKDPLQRARLRELRTVVDSLDRDVDSYKVYASAPNDGAAPWKERAEGTVDEGKGAAR